MYFRTLSKAVNHYTALGYTYPFDFSKPHPDDNTWKIVDAHRFEGHSDPSDNSVLYLLENTDGIGKGMVIDCYGAGRDERINRFLQDLARKFPEWILESKPPPAPRSDYEAQRLHVLNP